MDIIQSLSEIFEEIDVSWIDSSKHINKSDKYYDLLSLFPNLRKKFEEGRQKDEVEFHRTVKHIFRIFKIYFLMKAGEFNHNTLSSISSQTISRKVKNQFMQNELVLPLILMYHDIGRFIDKNDHPNQSVLFISNNNLLESFKLEDADKLLIKKVIQYHLLFAAIYTGESTYFGIYSLLNDKEFIKLFSNERYFRLFIDSLEIFTYIDILGYSYAKIYDHYIKYFNEINKKLKTILSFWPDKESALEKAIKFSNELLEWRIAGALRIFQFVDTKSYLTREFYFNKIKESVFNINNVITLNVDWNSIQTNYLKFSYQIQIKYGLGFLMLLSKKCEKMKFERSPMKRDQIISSNLILFWIILSKEIGIRSKGDMGCMWNVYFKGLPIWSKWDGKMKKLLNHKTLESIIKSAYQNFDQNKKEFNLYLDFKKVFT
ncbi:hypothetical protein LCGC14_0494450 [marine sediment metagenome]|uniref:HD domain-containing protein n=1 Tax=marine sediment metagenome TaxID=412755 RepID=A0A0F9USK7_9ZZZZ